MSLYHVILQKKTIILQYISVTPADRNFLFVTEYFYSVPMGELEISSLSS